MQSESGDRRPVRVQQGGTRTQPPEPEQLPCPRCDSTNTKFCYYNNYNLSQPRHFCKSCRRYWTRGGTLRNVPVGGGTRKNPNNRRSRTTTAAPSSSSSTLTYDAANAIPIIAGNKTKTDSPLCADVNLNEGLPETESFTSLLNPPGAGFFALGGFGVGAGSGFGDIGLGFGAGVWHMEVGGGSDSGAGPGSGSNSWQLGGVEGELADGDCVGWPDLAISTSGNGLN